MPVAKVITEFLQLIVIGEGYSFGYKINKVQSKSTSLGPYNLGFPMSSISLTIVLAIAGLMLKLPPGTVASSGD